MTARKYENAFWKSKCAYYHDYNTTHLWTTLPPRKTRKPESPIFAVYNFLSSWFKIATQAVEEPIIGLFDSCISRNPEASSWEGWSLLKYPALTKRSQFCMRFKENNPGSTP